MSIIFINSQAVCSPSSMELSIVDNYSKETNLNGNAVIDRVATKRNIKLKWAYLTAKQLKTILEAISDNDFFTVTYDDPITAGSRSMECYCVQKDIGITRYINSQPVWTDATMTFNER